MSDEFDSLLEDLDPLGGEISAESQAALSEAASLPTEELPPLWQGEPFVTMLVGISERSESTALGTTDLAFLHDTWGAEVFAASAYMRALEAEFEHGFRKRAYLDALKRPKGKDG